MREPEAGDLAVLVRPWGGRKGLPTGEFVIVLDVWNYYDPTDGVTYLSRVFDLLTRLGLISYYENQFTGAVKRIEDT